MMSVWWACRRLRPVSTRLRSKYTAPEDSAAARLVPSHGARAGNNTHSIGQAFSPLCHRCFSAWAWLFLLLTDVSLSFVTQSSRNDRVTLQLSYLISTQTSIVCPTRPLINWKTKKSEPGIARTIPSLHQRHRQALQTYRPAKSARSRPTASRA